MPKKIYIRTFGCQMNERDAEAIAEMFGKGGTLVSDTRDASVVVFVTCAVRQHAEERVWGKLGMIAKARKKNKPVIALCGCMAQEHKEKVFEKLPSVDIVLGPANINDLPKLVERALAGETHLMAVDKEVRPVDISLPHRRDAKFCASTYVNIMYGCDNYCSYCVVPYVRGREVSRPMEQIIAEVKELVDNGTEEVMLLGQNVNSYESAKPLRKEIASSPPAAAPRNDFIILLQELNKINGLEKISFTTSHPKDAGEDLFQAMRDLDKVVKHLHLPVQSGSNKILTAMNRGYTRKGYLDKVRKLRGLIPNCEITTDIIVGFPGEGDEDFQDTVELVKEVRFNSAYIFKYSSRPFTKAAELEDDVPKKVKEERNQILLDLQRSISRSYKS